MDDASITIHCSNLTPQEEIDLRFLLVDALHDFQAARKGDYVARRYADMGETFKKSKQESVNRRLPLAHKLQTAAYHVTITKG